MVLPEADLQLCQLNFGLPDGLCGSISLVSVVVAIGMVEYGFARTICGHQGIS